MTHVDMIEDGTDLIDVHYYCSALCWSDAHGGESAFGHAYPAPSWPDYAVYCHACGELLHEALPA